MRQHPEKQDRQSAEDGAADQTAVEGIEGYFVNHAFRLLRLNRAHSSRHGSLNR